MTDVIAWLNSPESDAWRERTFSKVYPLVSIKEDSVPFTYVTFLWCA